MFGRKKKLLTTLTHAYYLFKLIYLKARDRLLKQRAVRSMVWGKRGALRLIQFKTLSRAAAAR